MNAGRDVVKSLAIPLLAGVLLLPQFAAARTLHVPSEYPSIGAALAAAAADDVIEVACGTYYEHDLVMKSGVTLRSETGDPACVTVDAGGLGRVIRCSGVTASTRIEGLTLRGGYVSGYDPSDRGGGMLCDGEAEPQIIRCVLDGNVAHFGYGGGLSCYYASPALSECVFLRNEVHGDDIGNYGVGGAVDCRQSGARFEACTFADNVAHDDGGAIYARESPITLVSCEFSRNRADRQGGAVACRSADVRITGCTFNENVAHSDGGGIFFRTSASPAVVGCVLSGNIGRSGGGVFIGDHSSPAFTDVRFVGNEAYWGGAADVWGSSSPRFDRCIFTRNHATGPGGAIMCSNESSPNFSNCTFAMNSADGAGSFLRVDGYLAPVFERCIVAFHSPAPVVRCLGDPQLRFVCSDIYGNAGGDWVEFCLADQAGIDGNFSADPLFCDLEGGDYHLDCLSPCAPAQQPECGLIGALEVGCGASATTRGSWGLVKSLFRSD